MTAAISGGTYLSVAETSPNKALAWEFVKYALGTLEGQQAVYEGGGMFPGFKPMLDSDGFVMSKRCSVVPFWFGTRSPTNSTPAGPGTSIE